LSFSSSRVVLAPVDRSSGRPFIPIGRNRRCLIERRDTGEANGPSPTEGVTQDMNNGSRGGHDTVLWQ
jgi:hypothetical protein